MKALLAITPLVVLGIMVPPLGVFMLLVLIVDGIGEIGGPKLTKQQRERLKHPTDPNVIRVAHKRSGAVIDVELEEGRSSYKYTAPLRDRHYYNFIKHDVLVRDYEIVHKP